MGVKGFTRLLQQEGFLDGGSNSNTKDACAATSLWADANNLFNNKFASNVSLIPKRSTLYVDGTGFAFHVYRVAYSQHVQDVLQGSSRKSTSSCPCSAKHLRPNQVTQLLPHFLPLWRLDQVTRKFVDELKKKHHMKLIFYWDGPQRRQAKLKVQEQEQNNQQLRQQPTEWTAKSETDRKRRRKRLSTDWANLQQYCCNGVMPSTSCVCRWDDDFPKNRLFMEQIQFSLRGQVEMVDCLEEADTELAKQAAATSGYVVGNDSDFCFFPSTKYIPLSTLNCTDSVVTACVLSRERLAEALDLPDDKSMVELAILLGTDYIPEPHTAEMDFQHRADAECKGYNISHILEHLRDQGPGYRVTSRCEETQLGTSFIRASYNLENLDEEFPLVEREPIETKRPTEEARGVHTSFRKSFPLDLAKMQPTDTSLKSAVLRCLQAFVDQQQSAGEGTSFLRQEHLEAFAKMFTQRLNPQAKEEDWRPQWEDIAAAYWIEKAIIHSLKSSRGSPLMRLSAPSSFYNGWQFHAMLRQLRTPDAILEPSEGVKSTGSGHTFDHTLGSAEIESEGVKPLVLPIDEHEHTIISAIQRNRVTIIQGETGSGKSCRVPIMIMNAPPPDSYLSEVQLFISQPRRIAAKALVERLRSTEPKHGKKLALRMGHGVREYESSTTKAWFVTTGYLVRLLANHPEKFNKCSHLIIDEVHERGIDTDILCLLCRRLLQSNTKIRLVLMSATLAAKLYQEYFDMTEPPIKVGARRFPIEEIFVEELPEKLHLPPKEVKACQQIENECRKTMCMNPPSNSAMEALFLLASRIAVTVGRPGRSVLIFVPGMNDIISIIEMIEKMYVPGIEFVCKAIHSDLPFEDQMTVFDSLEAYEVKIIVATNAAESSITLPDCDYVICTGLMKQITYNQESHRQILLPCWISRASAQQRSGRVGRVRPGTVFRLYSREAYCSMMQEFESGEMLRIPLDSVLLMLKDILPEKTTPALLECIEPPNLSAIDRSYISLFKSNFITQPDDDGRITTLGAFVTKLGIDLKIGALVGLGIQFGVGSEAVELAAALSFPKSPWIISNPLVHTADQYNKFVAKTFVSKCQFDTQTFSEPLGAMNLMYQYRLIPASRVKQFCVKHGVHYTRLRRLIATSDNLMSRVAEFVKLDPSRLRLELPPAHMPHSKLTILRLIQAWVFSDTIIEYSKLSLEPYPDGSLAVGLKGEKLTEAHLQQVLDSERHPHELRYVGTCEQTGYFAPPLDDLIDSPSRLEESTATDFYAGFELRFLSFLAEKDFSIGWVWFEDEVRVYVKQQFASSSSFAGLCKLWDKSAEESLVFLEETTGHLRGRSERASGKWSLRRDMTPTEKAAIVMRKFIVAGGQLSPALRMTILSFSDLNKAISFEFRSPSRKKSKKKRQHDSPYQVFSFGSIISEIDLRDLLSVSQGGLSSQSKKETWAQKLVFRPPTIETNKSLDQKSPLFASKDSSWNRPLLINAPEGARLLSVLAAGRRRENNLQFPNSLDEENGDEYDGADLVRVALDDGLSKFSSRWKRMDTDRTVFVNENSVVASVVPVDCAGTLYCCCANTLDLRGGALRAEGLTLLPPGRSFLLLALLVWGEVPAGVGYKNDGEDVNEEVFVAACLKWIAQENDTEEGAAGEAGESDKLTMSSRIGKALKFARSCVELGEQLVCFPDKVKALCEIFNFVDGYESKPWETLETNPFIPESDEMPSPVLYYLPPKPMPAPAIQPEVSVNRVDEDDLSRGPDQLSPSHYLDEDLMPPQAVPNSDGLHQGTVDSVMPVFGATFNSSMFQNGLGQQLQNGVHDFHEEKRIKETEHIITELTSFPASLLSNSSLFAAEAGLNNNKLPTTNILSLLVKQMYNGVVYASLLQPELRERASVIAESRSEISLLSDYWTIHCAEDLQGKLWYRALLSRSALPIQRSKVVTPRWLDFEYHRPTTIDDALACLPPDYRDICIVEVNQEMNEGQDEALFFEDIESAFRMEAAFCLEREFRTQHKHWYEQTYFELVRQITDRVLSLEEIINGSY